MAAGRTLAPISAPGRPRGSPVHLRRRAPPPGLFSCTCCSGVLVTGPAFVVAIGPVRLSVLIVRRGYRLVVWRRRRVRSLLLVTTVTDHLPLVARVTGQSTLTRRLGRALGVIRILGILGAVAQQALVPRLLEGLVGG